MTSRRHLLPVLALGAACLAIYGQTIDDEWHLDDVLERSWPGVQDFRPTVSPAHYRGIVTLYVWSLNYWVSGDDPWSYHVSNLLIHFGNAVLVYWIVWTLAAVFPARDARPSYAHVLLATTAAFIFCTHPLATQTVAYVTQRSTSLATFFLLGSFGGYLALRTSRLTAPRTWLLLAGSVVAFQAGLHTKHVAMVLPLWVIAFEWSFRGTIERPRGHQAVWAILIAVLLLVRLGDFIPRHLAGLLSPSEAPSPEDSAAATDLVTRTSYMAMQPRVILTYLRLMLVPVNQNLDYDLRAGCPPFGPEDAGFVLFVVTLIVVAMTIRRHPVLRMGILMLFAALAPTSSFVTQPDLIFEHRAYAPLVGFAICVGYCLVLIYRTNRSRGDVLACVGAWATSAIVIAVLGILAFARTGVWDSEISLWTDTVAKSPGKVRPRLNLASALQRAGRMREAEVHNREALEIDPRSAVARNNLGIIHWASGRVDEARRMFEEAMSVAPESPDAYLNLGNVNLETGRLDEAERLYRCGLTLAPGSAAARFNLGKVHEYRGRWPEAIKEYERAVDLEPYNVRFLTDLGQALYVVGRLEDAEAVLLRATRRRPAPALAHFHLGQVYEATGRRASAVAEYEIVRQADPGFSPALDRLRILSGGE